MVISSIVRRYTLHRSPSHPPSFAIISSIVRDDTLTFAATRWVFVAWRAQIERRYNPQGGSIPHTSLPRVASYRRQPRAIESTTPMGLHRHQPLITTPQRGMRIILRWNCAHHCPFITALRHRDSAHHGIYHHATTRSVTIPSRGIVHRIAIHCQPRHRGCARHGH